MNSAKSSKMPIKIVQGTFLAVWLKNQTKRRFSKRNVRYINRSWEAMNFDNLIRFHWLIWKSSWNYQCEISLSSNRRRLIMILTMKTIKSSKSRKIKISTRVRIKKLWNRLLPHFRFQMSTFASGWNRFNCLKELAI